MCTVQHLRDCAFDLLFVNFINTHMPAAACRWHGYHPDQHKQVVERFNKLDEERRRARQQEQEDARKVTEAT